MNIVVLVKQVPDTEAAVRPDSSAPARIVESGIKFIVNPYDEFAVEEAIRIKEAKGGHVLVVTVGPPRAEEALRTCIAMGADDAMRIDDSQLPELDALGRARLLSKAISKSPFDLILCGKQAIDDDLAAVGTFVAEFLELPHVAVVTKLELANGKAICRKEIDGGAQTVELQLPAVITAQKGLNEPRYPALRGLMLAKKKEIAVVTPSSLGISAEELRPSYRVQQLESPPTRGKGKILQGEPETTAVELVRLLREEAKVF
ncbi:MAG: electron transfer flavoprotein subunit beta/FixA family protein [bacterium]|jgi:electron transfer flavoprotein beta subunit|nr:electron transfer flavoprotein subunit beta/FixA family protein [candidate division KSB1 bacterium]MDH7558902.1 electron transfer flavoprotein subunit beta/FixA family protein [bacterium]